MILPETSERSGTPSKKSMIRRRRHSSAITLEYTQLQKENDREALNAFADSVKNLGAALLGSMGRVTRYVRKGTTVSPETTGGAHAASHASSDKKGVSTRAEKLAKRKTAFSIKEDLFSDKISRSSFMINPLTHTKLLWDSFVMFFIIWNCCSVPYHTALQPRYNCSAEELADKINTDCYPRESQNFDIVIYLVFWLDIIVQARTGFVNDQQHIVMQTWPVLKRYLLGWALVDVVVAIPLDIFAASATDEGFIEIRLLQMLKLGKIAPLTKGLDKTPQANVFRLARVILGLVMLGHWIGCMYFYLGNYQLESYDNLGCNEHTGCPWIYQYNLTEANLYTQYSSSLYWGMTMLTSVEFGYVSPHTNIEKYFAWFCQLLGAILTALIFGEVVAAVQDYEGSNARYRRVMDKTNAFLKFHNLPKDLAKRVRNSMEYGWTLHSGMDQHQLMSVLPPAMRMEVLMHVQKNVMENCNMFKNCAKPFIKAMCIKMMPVAYLPGETVYEEGDATREVFFVSRGKFRVVTSTGRVLSILSEGDYFGELSYFDYTRRSAAVEAATYGEVYVIEAEDLDDILNRFPEYQPVLKREAKNHAKAYDKGTFATARIGSKFGLGNRPSSASNRTSVAHWLDNSVPTIGGESRVLSLDSQVSAGAIADASPAGAIDTQGMEVISEGPDVDGNKVVVEKKKDEVTRAIESSDVLEATNTQDFGVGIDNAKYAEALSQYKVASALADQMRTLCEQFEKQEQILEASLYDMKRNAQQRARDAED